MEIYDQNVLNWGMNPIIESVKDAVTIHKRMVELDIKVEIGSPFDMPHYRGEQKYGWDLMPNLFRIPALARNKPIAKQVEKQGWEEFEKVIKLNFGDDALRTLFDNEKHGKDWDLLIRLNMQL